MSQLKSLTLVKFVVKSGEVIGVVIKDESEELKYLPNFLDYLFNEGFKLVDEVGRVYKVVEIILGNSFVKSLKCTSDIKVLTKSNWVSKRGLKKILKE